MVYTHHIYMVYTHQKARYGGPAGPRNVPFGSPSGSLYRIFGGRRPVKVPQTRSRECQLLAGSWRLWIQKRMTP